VRGPKVGALLKDLDADIYCLQEVNTAEQVATINAALPDHEFVPSVAKNPILARRSILTAARTPAEYALSAYQSRKALVVHFDVLGQSERIAVVNTHLPSGNQAAREAAVGEDVKLLADVDDRRIHTGDFNSSEVYPGGPRDQLLKAGWADLRRQTDCPDKPAEHTDRPDFTDDGRDIWLADIWTRPDELTISDGHVVETNLSDHRPLVATIAL
jgi:endonuclease/exonuclease/phosphatase family metal-dependent hydrolase